MRRREIAGDANLLVIAARKNAEEGDGRMKEIRLAMDGISRSSADIFQVIRLIGDNGAAVLLLRGFHDRPSAAKEGRKADPLLHENRVPGWRNLAIHVKIVRKRLVPS